MNANYMLSSGYLNDCHAAVLKIMTLKKIGPQVPDVLFSSSRSASPSTTSPPTTSPGASVQVTAEYCIKWKARTRVDQKLPAVFKKNVSSKITDNCQEVWKFLVG